MFVILLAACRPSPVWDGPAADAPHRPEPHPTTAVALARIPGGRFVLPPSSRPGGGPAPERFVLQGTFEKTDSRASADVWRIPLPVHDNLLPTRTEGTHVFGSDEPPGLVITGPTGKLRWALRGRSASSYGFDREWLYVGVAPGTPAPVAADFTVHFPVATAAENALNFATSGVTPEAFVQRDLTVGQDAHRGLYLPAPAEAAFSITVPDRGVLTFDARLLRPPIRSSIASDGATVRVFVRDQDGEQAVGVVELPDTTAAVPARIELTRWQGQAIDLVIRTDPGADPSYDHVLLDAPVVYTPSDHPRRIVLVFVDTLRPDHLGFYGYERPTTPNLDRWAADATVFEQARSVAPWTLPSARAVLSGHQPEAYFDVPRLQDTLSLAGWRTESHVTNAFLSHVFDTQLGWDHYRYDHLLDAEDVISDAVETVGRYPDRDLLVLVHFMDTHLPYDEPKRFRGLFVGGKPPELKELTRAFLVKELKADNPAFDAIRTYVTGRYDQGIRTVDDALPPLLQAVGGDATVVLFSDHGEELWDHGSYEHGHSFYDELLHVPLAIKSPLLPSGRHGVPVSLLDVTPTLLEVAGLPPDPTASGRSLVGLAWGDAGEGAAFTARPQAFGRPLYGDDGWGVVADGHKWWDRGGVEQSFDLTADPTEQHPGADRDAPWPLEMQAALGRDVHTVWRVLPKAPLWASDVELTISHPAGIRAAWLGYEPRGPVAVAPEVRDGQVHVRIPGRTYVGEVIYVLPNGDPKDVAGLAMSYVGRGVNAAGSAEGPAATGPLFHWESGRYGATVNLATVPEPSGRAVEGFHPDVAAQLKELGYVD